jgi:hypothetical protein
MGILQAFALGVMVVWTPSLVLLAWMLWGAPLIGFDERSDIAAGDAAAHVTSRSRTFHRNVCQPLVIT